MGNVYTVTATSDDSNSGLTLSEAIDAANANPGSTIDFALAETDTYTLTGTLPEITADVTIDGTNIDDGQNVSLDGGGKYQGLYVYSGTAVIENLTLDHTAAIGQAGSTGGNGSFLAPGDTIGAGGGGGGGAGLGGGLFVGSKASVTLSNVSFASDSAIGGSGGIGGIVDSEAGGTSFGGSGGGFEGGIGGKGAQTKGAGGSAGGFGAGGGGGAGSSGSGGAGGFGGGGGGGGGITGPGVRGRTGGTGGFGGGHGSAQSGAASGAPGGGGLGAGADIFIEQGATLTVEGGTLGAGTVQGGFSDGNEGDGLGSGIFLQGNQSVTFAPAIGETVTVSGVIADQSGSGGTGDNAGTGSLIMGGAGTLVLAADNATDSGSFGPGGFTGGITIEAGTVDLTAASAAGSGPLTFDASGDPTLEFTPATAPTNPIDGFGTGNSIQIDDFIAISDSYADGVLTLFGTDQTQEIPETVELNIPGQVFSNFHVTDSPTDTVISYVACYCARTLIRTPCGNQRVEKLQIGDEVMTASGAARPIKWIGRRSYLGRFVMGRKDILPVCIKADALADNVPRRDLWISPNHAMYFEGVDKGGVLIEAKDLVNGASILQAERVDQVEYFHIELESHDVIIAEGALSESFIDDDSRFMFHNAHEYREKYPDRVTGAAKYCAPRCDSGYEMEALRQRIALRAGLTPGCEATLTGNVRGYVDRVTKERVAGWAYNIDHPEAPVCIDILAGGVLVGQVLANRYRADLEQAGIGDGCHSFEFVPPPEKPLAPEQVEVRRSLDGRPLELTIEAWQLLQRRQDRVSTRPAVVRFARSA